MFPFSNELLTTSQQPPVGAGGQALPTTLQHFEDHSQLGLPKKLKAENPIYHWKTIRDRDMRIWDDFVLFCLVNYDTVDGRNPANQLKGSLSHYLQCFMHPRWCRISSINSKSRLHIQVLRSWSIMYTSFVVGCSCVHRPWLHIWLFEGGIIVRLTYFFP